MSDKPKAKHLRVVKTGEDHEQLIKQEDPKPVNGEVLETLNRLNEQALAGELTGLIYVAAYDGESVTPHCAGQCISYGILGALYALAASVAIDIAQNIGIPDEDEPA
jgi:high-affinity K+ transport system ATPase subunit B